VSVAVKEGKDVMTSEPRPIDAAALAQAIEAAMARRIAGLLGTCVRTRKARIGSDAASSAWHSGEAALLVVATDAAAAADLGAVRDAVATGFAVAWGTKLSLAAALHRPDRTEGVSVLAIMDTRIASGSARRGLHHRKRLVPSQRRKKAPLPVQGRVIEDASKAPDVRGKVGADRAHSSGGRRVGSASGAQQAVVHERMSSSGLRSRETAQHGSEDACRALPIHRQSATCATT
jgi:pimeloyl-ACP methyl ester carboxylesterase